MTLVIVRNHLAPSYVASIESEEGDTVYLKGESFPFRKNRKGSWFLDRDVSPKVREIYDLSQVLAKVRWQDQNLQKLRNIVQILKSDVKYS